MSTAPISIASPCPRCGTPIAPTLTACPACKHLLHAERLKRLADFATHAEATGDFASAIAAWREAQPLLPRDSSQYRWIAAQLEALAKKVPPGAATVLPPELRANADAGGTVPAIPDAKQMSRKSGGGKAAGAIGAAALILWKFKALFVFLVTKGKILLLGLTKASTFTSMLLSAGVYWTAFGWKFAVGLVLSIYIHEMGHVAMLKHYGIAATAPMFIPGVGALIRLKQRLPTAGQEARVGLAGPVWGTAAALAAYGVALATGWPSWLAIAEIGAWINLFNLTPIWQLDGSHAFESLTRTQRWLATGAVGAAWFATHEGLLAIILFCAIGRTLVTKPAGRRDDPALMWYVGLVAVLSAMCLIEVPV